MNDTYSSSASKGVLIDGFIKPAVNKTSPAKPVISSSEDYIIDNPYDNKVTLAQTLPVEQTESQLLGKRWLRPQIGQNYIIVLHVLLFAAVSFFVINSDTLSYYFLFMTYIILSLTLRLSSRYSFACALFAISVTSLAILIKNEQLAEAYATYGYLFLLLGVFRLLWELRGQEEPISGFDWPKS